MELKIKIPLFFFFAAMVLVTSPLSPVHAAEKKGKERLAVLDLESKYGVDEGLAEALSIIVRTKLHSFGDYQVLSKSDILAVASREQLKQALGCDDGTSQCLVNFGRAIGTRFMVAGAISKLGSTYTISLRMLDTKSDSAGVVNLVSESCKCPEDDLIGTAENVATKLFGKPSPVLTKKVEFEKPIIDENKGAESATVRIEPEQTQKLTHEKTLAEEAEKQRQALLAEERRKEEERRLAAETERLKIEKEAAEVERTRLALEEQKKIEIEEERRLTVKRQKAEEQKKVEEETAKRIAEELHKEEEKKLAAEAIKERFRLAEEKKLEEETSKRSAEKKLAEEKKRQKQEELVKQQLVAEAETEKQRVAEQHRRAEESPEVTAAIRMTEGEEKIEKSMTVPSTENTSAREKITLRQENIGKISADKLYIMIRESNFYEKDLNPSGFFKNDFVLQNADVVLDQKTGLLWQIGGSSKSMNLGGAKGYIEDLNNSKNSGCSDWRLPTIEELASLMKKNIGNGFFTDPIFSQTIDKCWSSDEAPTPHTYNRDLKRMWLADFKAGRIVFAALFETHTSSSFMASTEEANTENYVRAVCTLKEKHEKQDHIGETDKLKDGQNSGSQISLRKAPKKVTEPELVNTINENNFFEKNLNPNGSFDTKYDEIVNGTVTDSSTGLMWQKSGTPKRITIYEAQSYVKELNEQKYGGYSDWRLPTLAELASLPRKNRVEGLYIDALFDRTQLRLWSSDISIGYIGQPGSVDTNFILDLEKGSFAQAIFRKFTAAGQGSGYLVNDENYARVVRSYK